MTKEIEISMFRRDQLKSDCENCFGLCCVALFFSKQDGFPINKSAGEPCVNLKQNFHCKIHTQLKEKKMKGCLGYECFGAGQKVAQHTYGNRNWLAHPDLSNQMYEVFLVMNQLHELLWYLTEAYFLTDQIAEKDIIENFMKQLEKYTKCSPEEIKEIPVAQLWTDINSILKRVSEDARGMKSKEKGLPQNVSLGFGGRVDLCGKDLRKMDFTKVNVRGAFLIAANGSGVDFTQTDFAGADFRDFNIKGADLSKSLYLTASQMNVAIGDNRTKLPPFLERPAHWNLTVAE